MGQVTARVQLLEARPMRCFKCLCENHARVNCFLEEDRSSLCYRCGKASHQARGCTAEAWCPLSTDLGMPAKHRYGGLLANPTTPVVA